ncbi:MAG TPA: helicase-related protein, partial [Polyangium sp.]|nr:helicase-related protein [Polyangium sp.]
MGLPLRLLAREVYDKVTARIGEARVALVTGEEKRVPRRPDYWICTTEAMPKGRDVDFVAVDEIQLAAHHQRGHVFTERLLEMRGKKETWFLGAASMKSIVSGLLPAAKIAEHPRLSRLSFTGTVKLAHIPVRSAIVAFSMQDVYEVAERLRAQRGGAAVVLGALSPRTRNAQVAMFQAGEVDYLVATDAIGMGLNLDVKHVAFASLRKFDGHDARELDPAEMGQIAGRAGRYTTDGSFGALAPLAIPQGMANAVETHRFSAVGKLMWRSSDLDMTSIDELTASLKRAPTHRALLLQTRAEDSLALERLARDPWIRQQATSKDSLRLLWDVCCIPDYRKLLLETHVALLSELYGHLVGPKGTIDETWMNERVCTIDDPSGDIDTLIARIQAIRTWTYVSHREAWVKHAADWQARTAAIEDRLSDALHERLVQRFVEKGRKGRFISAKIEEPKDAAAKGRQAKPYEKLAAWKAANTVKSAPTNVEPPWVDSIAEAHHTQLALDDECRIVFEDGRVLGTLIRGTSLLLPEVRLAGLNELGAGSRLRISRRLLAFARDLVVYLLMPLRLCKSDELSGAARGILYRLEEGLGTTVAREAQEQLNDLTADDRDKLEAVGIVLGRSVVFLPALLRGHALVQRTALVQAFADGRDAPSLPRASTVSIAVKRGVNERLFTAIGFPVFGPRAVRADVAERVFSMVVEEKTAPHRGKLAGLLGCPAREAEAVVQAALGTSWRQEKTREDDTTDPPVERN